jgi:hypothetical protein
MMSTLANFGRDVQGFNAYAPAFAIDNFATTLSANTEQHFTVPSNFKHWLAVFSFNPGSNVWVANNTTATLPSGSFASILSVLNPAVRSVEAGDVLSFISADTTDYVGVTLYAVQQ